MLIKIALLLLVLALTVLLAADWLLGQGIALLPEQLAKLGILLLLAGFVPILAGVLLGLGKRLLVSVSNYFSRPQRLQRKLLFVADRQRYLAHLLPFKTAYIAYFNEQRRKTMLAADNKKHIRLLYKATRQHLQTLKKQLPPDAYRRYRQASRHYYHLQDIQALLSLQQTLDALEKP